MRALLAGVLLSASSAVLFAAADVEPPRVDARPVTLFRDAKRYTSFPDVKRLPDGRLLCVFRDAPFPEKVRHIEVDARVVGVASDDQGRSWSKPFVIHESPDCHNDPSVAVLHDGRLLLHLGGTQRGVRR
jgi:hypothetical protein